MIIGTETISLADLVETINRNEKVAKEIDFGSLRLTKRVGRLIDAGFRHIELALDTRFLVPGAADDSVIDELLELRKKVGVSYSVHLPIYDTSFMSLNDRIRRATLDCLKESVIATEPLEITGYVLHPTRFFENELSTLPLPMAARRKIFRYIVEKGSQGLSELIEAAGNPRKILLEQDNAIPPDAIFEPLLREYDVGICFDYGHHVMFKMDPIAFFDDHCERIREIHFHDVALKYKIDHLPLGGGSTEWQKFVMHITREDRFDGVLLLEMMESAAIASLPKLLEVLGI